MSEELIAIVALGVTMVGMFAGGFGRVAHRFDKLDDKLSARIDGVDASLSARIDRVESDVRHEFAAVRGELGEVHRELTEVKIAVARIEGPQRRLLAP